MTSSRPAFASNSNHQSLDAISGSMFQSPVIRTRGYQRLIRLLKYNAPGPARALRSLRTVASHNGVFEEHDAESMIGAWEAFQNVVRGSTILWKPIDERVRNVLATSTAKDQQVLEMLFGCIMGGNGPTSDCHANKHTDASKRGISSGQ
jgi:hypothetical protein